jgi:hypothetical protein
MICLARKHRHWSCNEGDLHSPWRDASTKLVRIEGRNVEKIRRFRYEAVS